MEKQVLALLAQAPDSTRTALASGTQKIYTLHIFDNLEEDGDAVELFVDGVSYGPVILWHSGTDLTIPLSVNTPSAMHVVALSDGGGGVTYAVRSSTGELRSKVMAVGESDDWTVTPQ